MSDPFLALTPVYPPPTDEYKDHQPPPAHHQQHLLPLSPPPIDFFSFNSADILAPHPDLFESELDSSLAAFNESDIQLQLLTVDSNDAFAFLRSDTPTHSYRSAHGPPSTLTVSSESFSQGYDDSLSAYSESFYNAKAASHYSLPIDMDFQRIRVDPGADYAAAATPSPAASGLSSLTDDPNSFGALPQHQQQQSNRSPPMVSAANPNHSYTRSSAAYSDYTRSPPVVRSSAASDYYPQLKTAYNTQSAHGASVAPHNVSARRQSQAELPLVPAVPPIPLVRSFKEAREEMHSDDPRKKYKCPSCPRAFARAYNLKTHMATHDPNRPKPHMCPHKSCGRSFSRKHDLGRHLVSIHREDSSSVYSNGSTGSARVSAVGVEKGPRGWCESCGKGWVGRDYGCECRDVK
ncbi:hypothetical protein PUNSTDRAFT_117360 [Punctularia strigosozonata HHB-11173 SS5]|uniref:uncharacterized protein n=1 Tax=Punctularia strigosozonata (strain HHB-11173) TaxID=741275 RepID=UPI0004417774|nr:uncharacterized protein PUNSTDRAFT_117360 [Punctularia strigosozonata HHB-11173 SS5]EIN13643.1 hypothetical protein PUNSTDRAFT_117360 [Punctularia strigosozonata HHB-11173 SS5]